MNIRRGCSHNSINGKTAFEIHQQTGNSFKTTAELYTPDGKFLKISDSNKIEGFNINGDSLKIGNIMFTNSTFENTTIGIWLQKDGSLSVGGM